MSMCTKQTDAGVVMHKRSYRTRAKARKAARNAQVMLGPMGPYRCSVCGFYHIGHAPKGGTQ